MVGIRSGNIYFFGVFGAIALAGGLLIAGALIVGALLLVAATLALSRLLVPVYRRLNKTADASSPWWQALLGVYAIAITIYNAAGASTLGVAVITVSTFACVLAYAKSREGER